VSEYVGDSDEAKAVPEPCQNGVERFEHRLSVVLWYGKSTPVNGLVEENDAPRRDSSY